MQDRILVQLQMASEIAPPEEGEAEGCIQCQKGSKLVLFVTGRCHWGCDYCPLSDNRRESPDMFANERRCSNFDEVIETGEELRYNNAGTKTFVKFEGNTPEFLSGKTQYTYSEIKAELNKSEWIKPYD